MSANVVEILVTAKDLASPTMARVNAEVNGVSKSMAAFHKTAMIGAAGLVALGAESVKMASKFDASMQLLHTQAGVSQSKIAGLKQGVLDLAGKVGQSPDSLAEALYHVESNFESTGISGAKALKLVETAAKGATVGHADLVDVTNALTAAVASGIPGVQNMDQAMGALNATVGAGDMKMQDLADAFGTGMLATVKGFGVTIQDVGAGLAVFGDNNVRGAKAGTEFRMMIQGLAHPVATAKDELSKLGLAQDDLAHDMQKGGLNAALKDLVGRMKAAGVTSKEQGQVITDLFGKKAGQGINMLVSEFEKVESKYPAVIRGAKNAGQAFADTQKTFAFQAKALQASFDALMITLGNKLMPPLQSFVSLMLAHKSATVAAVTALGGLLAATVAVSAAMKVAAAASMLWAAGAKAVAGLAGVFESVALKAMYMKEAFAAAGGGVAGLKAAFAELGMVGKATVITAGLAAVVAGVMLLSQVGKRVPPDVDRMTTALSKLGATGQATGEAVRIFGKDFGNLAYDIDRVAGKSQGMDKFNDVMNTIFTLGTKDSNSLNMAKEDIDAIDKSLASLVSGGKAQLAAAALSKLEEAYSKKGGDPKKLVGELDDYKAALASSSLQEKLTAQSMGLFGDQAVATQQKLDAEAQSAKGLEESVMALNQVHRAAFDAETAFYQAMSDASKAAKENGKTLDVTTDAGRKNRSLLSDLAAKTEDYVDKMNKQHFAADKVDKVYQQGRKNLIEMAQAMGDTAPQAKKLADELLNFPAAKKLKMQVDDKQATADLNAFNAAIKKQPGSKSVTLKTLSGAAEKVLEAFGYKVTHLKDGSVRITANSGQALGAIANVQGAVNSLHDKTITIMTQYFTANSPADLAAAHGRARGGMAPGYADGGQVMQTHPNGGLITGPGSGTSDSILELSPNGGMYRTSNREYIVQASAVARYGVAFLDALNSGHLKLAGFARGGHVRHHRQVKHQLTEAEKAQLDARKQLGSEFGISYFGKAAGYQRTPFERNLGAPQDVYGLVDSLNSVAGEIRAAFRGRTESNLLGHLASVGRALINHEKALTKINAALSSAKDKLTSLKDSASQLSDSVKSNLISSANITKAAGNNQGGMLTLAAVRAGMVVSRDKVLAFANALKRLAAKGYSKSIIQQVAEAGIDGGGLETAGALLEASASEVKSMNSLQGQIESAAGSAGKTTASAVYDAAIKAQAKVVDKLTRQQASLEKAMASLAKSMEQLLRRALGHKAAGGVVGMAASGGLRSSLTWVGEQGPELLDLPAGSRVFSNPDSRRMWAEAHTPWGSMLTTQRHAHATAVASVPARQEQRIVLEIRAGDSGQYTEFLVGELRRAVRARGSVEATFAPPRGR
ncbi:phage tail tape measure protein [Streptomyces sp. NPDC002078]